MGGNSVARLEYLPRLQNGSLTQSSRSDFGHAREQSHPPHHGGAATSAANRKKPACGVPLEAVNRVSPIHLLGGGQGKPPMSNPKGTKESNRTQTLTSHLTDKERLGLVNLLVTAIARQVATNAAPKGDRNA